MSLHIDHRVKLDGVGAYVNSVKNNGEEITLCGWDGSYYKYKTNDYLLLIQEDGKETRYRVKKLRPCGEPTDMYFLDCVFAPRSTENSIHELGTSFENLQKAVLGEFIKLLQWLRLYERNE